MSSSTGKNTASGLASALRTLLPAHIYAAAGPLSKDTSGLLPLEQEAAEGCKGVRRTEFVTGRRLLRPLFYEAGLPDFALLPGADRSPAWPAGYCGSISHSSSDAVVALGSREVVGGLGLDLELVGRIKKPLWERLFTRDECRQLESAEDADTYATVLFAAKEAYYKAQYPLTGLYLGFHDVEAVVGDGTLSLKAGKTPGFSSISRWVKVGQQVLVSVVIDPS